MKNENLKGILVFLTTENHMKLKMYCANIGMSMNNFIRHAIREKMEKDIKKKFEK